jgi:hypothetical protein
LNRKDLIVAFIFDSIFACFKFKIESCDLSIARSQDTFAKQVNIIAKAISVIDIKKDLIVFLGNKRLNNFKSILMPCHC